MLKKSQPTSPEEKKRGNNDLPFEYDSLFTLDESEPDRPLYQPQCAWDESNAEDFLGTAFKIDLSKIKKSIDSRTIPGSEIVEDKKPSTSTQKLQKPSKKPIQETPSLPSPGQQNSDNSNKLKIKESKGNCELLVKTVTLLFKECGKKCRS